MKVALVHDSLTQFGGAERVLQALHEIYPEAPVFTLIYDSKLKEHFEDWQIISSPLQYLYNIFPKFQLMLPLIPLALKFFNLSDFDVIISSSSIFAKGIKVSKDKLHINYCHTPARFLWFETEQYIKEEVPAILRPLVRLYIFWLRRWDYEAAQRVSHFIANSKNVNQRIAKYYNRDSEVIYPFVETENFYPDGEKGDYYLVAGRLQAHKRVEIVVEAFNKLGKKLHVVGTGRAVADLKALAKENIQFFGKVPDHVLRQEYSGALAFIYPQEEDFGIMPLEAMACGTPVIAYGKGGAVETITEKTGVFFQPQNTASLIDAVNKFKTVKDKFQSEDLFETAERFNKENFKDKIRAFVEAKYNLWKEQHAHRS